MPESDPSVLRRMLSKLGRIQGSSRLVPELESLRFAAITSVFLTHLNGYLMVKSGAPWAMEARGSLLDRVLKQGGLGVQLFFVISGFVLALPFARRHLKLGAPVPLGPYFVRRLTRLEPPYLLCLGLLFLAQITYNHESARDLLPHLAASAAYLHALIYHAMSPINGVTWSLEVEVQFYLAAPLLTWAFAVEKKSARRALLVAACLLLQGLQLALGLGDDRDNPTLLNYLPYFLMGFILADLYLDGWLARGPRHAAWDLLLAGTAAAALTLAVNRPQWLPLALPWSLLLAVTAFFKGRLLRRALGGPLPITIGGMCYSLYLFHFAVISAFARFSKDLALPGGAVPNLGLQLLITGAATLVLGGLFFALVERPCMRRDWPQRLGARLKSAVRRPGPAQA
jgi:peptidoglycan/LPS O-acetylase OafA/YrhL